MSATRDKFNVAALAQMLGGRPSPPELPQPLAVAAAGAGGGATEAAPAVFTGSVPTDWTGSPGGHDGRMMRVTYGAGTWGIQVQIYTVDEEDVETVHKTFDIAPSIIKVCIDETEVYRCVLMDPTTNAVSS